MALAAAQGSWINPAGITAFKKLAATYAQMAPRVASSASAAAKTHIVGPARLNGAHPETGVFAADDGSLYVGLPEGHPDTDNARDIEFGTETAPPGAQIRHALWTNRDQAVNAFHAGLTTEP